MKRSITIILALFVLLLIGITPVQAGGWAVVTLQNLPDQVNAGEPFPIEFAVRQHGIHLTSLFGTPIIYATHVETGETLSLDTEKTTREGYFTADLLFPQPGTWTWSIGVFGVPNMAQNMPPLTVVPGDASFSPAPLVSMPLVLGMIGLMAVVGAGVAYFATRTRWVLGLGVAGLVLTIVGLTGGVQPSAAAATVQSPPVVVPSVELGKALFVAKGCVVCHMQAEARMGFTGIQTDVGPNLTHTQLTTDYLRVWLKDPSSVKPETEMPNLELKETEIEALAMFLTAK